MITDFSAISNDEMDFLLNGFNDLLIVLSEGHIIPKDDVDDMLDKVQTIIEKSLVSSDLHG